MESSVWRPSERLLWSTHWRRARTGYRISDGLIMAVIRNDEAAAWEWYDPLATTAQFSDQPLEEAGKGRGLRRSLRIAGAQPATRGPGSNPVEDLVGILYHSELNPRDVLRHYRGVRPSSEEARIKWDPSARKHRRDRCSVCRSVEEAALRFADSWGLLGLYAVNERWASAEANSLTQERVVDLLEGSYRMGCLLERAARFGETAGEQRAELGKSLSLGFDIADPMRTGAVEVIGLDRTLMDGTRDRLVWDSDGDQGRGRLVLGHQASSLWHTCHLWLASSLTSERQRWKICRHGRCRAFFLTANPDRQYCSRACLNAAAVARSRARHRPSQSHDNPM